METPQIEDFDTQDLAVLAGEVADTSEEDRIFVAVVMGDVEGGRLSLDGARRYLENRKATD